MSENEPERGALSRRSFLRSVGAVRVGLSGAVAANITKTTLEPVALKGTERRPIEQKHIERQRDSLLQKFLSRSDLTLDEFVFSTPEIDGDEFVASYGLAFRNGAPVEIVETVPESESIVEDRIESAHGSLDTFVARHSKDSKSQSSQTNTTRKWRKVGEMTSKSDATFTDGGTSYIGGVVHLNTQLYKRIEDSRQSQTEYFCRLIGYQWPGEKLDYGVDGFWNWSSDLAQRWDRSQADEVDIEHAASTDDTPASVEWKTTSKHNETISRHYYYPADDVGITGQGSRYEIIGLKNTGRAWLSAVDGDSETFLETEMAGAFQGTKGTVCGPENCIGHPFRPKTSVRSVCSRYSLTHR